MTARLFRIRLQVMETRNYQIRFHYLFPIIIICIPLSYNLHTLELFTYPLGLKSPLSPPPIPKLLQTNIFGIYILNTQKCEGREDVVLLWN